MSKEIGIPFIDQKLYNVQMAKGMEDKLFFTKHLPQDNKYIFVDFGCANGALIKELTRIYPDSRFVGYDCSSSMIAAAKKNVNPNDYPIGSITFTTKWKEVDICLARNDSRIKVLVLSSVIHEIYSYAQDQKDIDFFWKILCSSRFDYICVRDMMWDNTMLRPSSGEAVEKLRSNPNIRNQIEDFEYIFGSIEENKNLVHFLLKYRYVVNWNREVHENYFPINAEEFLKKFTKSDIIYLERFRVPFLDECIMEDFGIRLTDHTHIKLVVRGFRHKGEI